MKCIYMPSVGEYYRYKMVNGKYITTVYEGTDYDYENIAKGNCFPVSFQATGRQATLDNIAQRLYFELSRYRPTQLEALSIIDRMADLLMGASDEELSNV